MISISKEKLESRITKFQQKLSKQNIEAGIIIQNADLFYFSGTIQGEYLYIPSNGKPILLVRSDNKRAKKETGLENVIEFKSSKELIDILKKENIDLPTKLGLELDILPYKTVTKLQQIFATDKVINITPQIRQTRMIKSDSEIKLIKRAANKLKSIPQLIKKNLTPDISELELSAIIEKDLRQKGHTGFIRMRGLNNELPLGVCTAGKKSTTNIKVDSICAGTGVHSSAGVGASKSTIKDNSPIILDYVATHHGYHADQTRMAIIGKPSAYLQKTYDKMVQLQTRLSKYLTPEYSWQDIYEEGKKLAEELEVAEYYLGYGNNKEKFVGHGVGVELNEFPFLASGLDLKLKPGMTIALEPKLVVPDIGAIGIENTYLVTKDKPEKLTTASEELITIKKA
ncbi:M24 family metallopeptidase [Sporohalobacter salinus]|uniref:M24 family metallopeptidase n=1 Tax=Sporohalobacter salinus TaxID=1494606 RepID=UPI0019612563|nr:Xaa-Pro peptidase family protein [Sporohalobacter salinus]MBM7622857.1 Xaa-Pro dipeptidase [Sporohalobacter salinus]